MGAVTADINTPQMGAIAVPGSNNYPVAASTIIYKGTLVSIDSSGNLISASDTASTVCVGRAAQHVDNSAGLAGALTCNVDQGVFRWANGNSITSASVGAVAYVKDNSTVATSGTSHTIVAGTIYAVDSDGVWVYSAIDAPIDASGLTTFESNLASTATGEGASLVGIEDSAALITATTVEGALAELVKKIFYMGVAPQALSGAGACNVTALVTNFTSTGSAQALTLADGTQTGQLKIVHHTVDGGSGVLTPTTAGNFATFTLTNVHDACLLQWTGSAWNIVLNVGGTVA